MQPVHRGVSAMQNVHRIDLLPVPEGQDMQDLHRAAVEPTPVTGAEGPDTGSASPAGEGWPFRLGRPRSYSR